MPRASCTKLNAQSPGNHVAAIPGCGVSFLFPGLDNQGGDTLLTVFLRIAEHSRVCLLAKTLASRGMGSLCSHNRSRQPLDR